MMALEHGADLVHSAQDFGGAHPLGYALVARVHQSEQVALVSTFC